MIKRGWFQWGHRTRIALIVAFSFVSILFVSLIPPVPLSPGYHVFADTRNLLHIPHCLDVLSNIPFVLVGVWGMVWVLRERSGTSFILEREKGPYLVFFLGVALTGIGSFWYHVAPDNARLPFDLLPMTWAFTSLLTACMAERISVRLGLDMLFPLLITGSASVGYWYVTQMRGHGDYRFYLFVQFFPPLLISLLVVLFPPRYSGFSYLVTAFVCFVFAKLFEVFDRQIFNLTGAVSGHSLKHVTAAVACYWILRMLQTRQALTLPKRVGGLACIEASRATI